MQIVQQMQRLQLSLSTLVTWCQLHFSEETLVILQLMAYQCLAKIDRQIAMQ